MEVEDPVQIDSLTIYLCRAGSEDECVDPEAATQRYSMRLGKQELGVLFVGQTPDTEPPWYRAIEPLILDTNPPQLRTRRARALWILPAVEGQFYCIAFGDGRHLLVSRRVVPNFGLQTVLNIVNADNIRALKKRTLETSAAHTRFQALEDIPIDEFLFDRDRDLLRGVSGVPTDQDLFGVRITGAESLSITGKLYPQDVPAALKKLWAAYNDSKYKERFEWVDNIQLVRDPDVIKKLEEKTNQLLADAHRAPGERCFAALPDLSDCPDAAYFRVSGCQDKSPDISLYVLRHFLGEPLSIERIRSKELRAVSAEDAVVGSWGLFECINVETQLNGTRYILADDEWFSIDSNFEARIKAELRRVPVSARKFPPYNDLNEEDYNKRIGADELEYALLDRVLINHGGGQSKFELCDLLSSKNEFIHVKKYEGSSQAMSHLFFQGLSSARLFKSDQAFRRKANERLPELYRLAQPDLPVDAGNWEIVFAIISAHDRPPAEAIPFFSQLSLSSVYRVLSSELGFRVSLAHIRTEERYKIIGAAPRQRLSQRRR